MELGPTHASTLVSLQSTTDPIDAFPAMGQPISDISLKEMLISLRSSLQADLKECVQQFRHELHDLEDRVANAESSMGEYTSAFNSMVDALHSEEIEWLKAKVADLEDRSRRNKDQRDIQNHPTHPTETIHKGTLFSAGSNTIYYRIVNRQNTQVAEAFLLSL